MIQLAGTLIIEEGKVLLLRDSKEGCWRAPGGRIEDDEAPTQASVRATQNEISSEIKLNRPFYSGEFQNNDKLYEWHCYLASIKDGRPEIQESAELDELKWFSRDEFIECDDLAPNLRMIEHGLKRLLN